MGDAFTDAAKDARREEQRNGRQHRHFSALVAYLERPSDGRFFTAAMEAFRGFGYGPDAPEVAAFGEELRGFARGDRPLWAKLLAAAFRDDVGRKYVELLKSLSPFAGMIVAAAEPAKWNEDCHRLYGERKELVRELVEKRGSFSLETPHGTFVALRPSHCKRKK